eukprot:gene16090-9548_t
MGDCGGITLSVGGDAGAVGLRGTDGSAVADPVANQGSAGGPRWGRIATGGMPGTMPEEDSAAGATAGGLLAVPKKQKPGGMGLRKKSSFLITAEDLAAKGEMLKGLPPDRQVIPAGAADFGAAVVEAPGDGDIED